MATKIRADREHLLKRLRELRDWACYIKESVNEDQSYEEGKMSLLREVLGSGSVLLLRADASSLADRLEEAMGRVESSTATVAY